MIGSRIVHPFSKYLMCTYSKSGLFLRIWDRVVKKSEEKKKFCPHGVYILRGKDI